VDSFPEKPRVRYEYSIYKVLVVCKDIIGRLKRQKTINNPTINNPPKQSSVPQHRGFSFCGGGWYKRFWGVVQYDYEI
jgi:hypothetical protein